MANNVMPQFLARSPFVWMGAMLAPLARMLFAAYLWISGPPRVPVDRRHAPFDLSLALATTQLIGFVMTLLLLIRSGTHWKRLEFWLLLLYWIASGWAWHLMPKPDSVGSPTWKQDLLRGWSAEIAAEGIAVLIFVVFIASWIRSRRTKPPSTVPGETI